MKNNTLPDKRRMPAILLWLNPSRPLKRWPYAALGVLLFGLKFNLDKWISYAT